jgi:hypothetical protein
MNNSTCIHNEFLNIGNLETSMNVGGKILICSADRIRRDYIPTPPPAPHKPAGRAEKIQLKYNGSSVKTQHIYFHSK